MQLVERLETSMKNQLELVKFKNERSNVIRKALWRG